MGFQPSNGFLPVHHQTTALQQRRGRPQAVYISWRSYVASWWLSSITQGSTFSPLNLWKEWSIVAVFSHTTMIARHRVCGDGAHADIGPSWTEDCKKAVAVEVAHEKGGRARDT